MKAKLHYVFTITIFLITFSTIGQNIFFEKLSTINKASTTKGFSKETPTYQFDYYKLKAQLAKSSKTAKNTIIISFPNLNGEFEKYKVVESSVLHPDLQAKYPEIKSYVARSLSNPSAHLRFSLSPYKGLCGIVIGKDKIEFFEPDPLNINRIKVLNKSQLEVEDTFKCLTSAKHINKTLKSASSKNADDSIKRTYRLALSVTGEYAQFHGGTLASVNAALVATLTNINAVFENDFNVSLELISNNDAIIFLDPNTDPYTNLFSYNSQLSNTLGTTIDASNYDIGHLLGGINDDNNDPTGDAGCIGCVCNDFGNIKGSGFSTGASPDGFNFDINFIAHEIGHQFGATHTWTHDGNEGTNTQIEPGSGSTIMGYAGITGSTNVQTDSDAYFHAISIEQITNFIKTTSCAIETNTGNTTPIVDAGDDLTLPIGTPFKLEGIGSDADGDAISFCWEQINENDAQTTFPDPNASDSNSILFRSYPPTTNPVRFFPNEIDLKFGINATVWEKLPNTSRTADFRLTVRDNRPNGANNSHDDMRVTFDNSYGPFRITSQNEDKISWRSGTTETITWNVNNTNSLPGAENVNILLSTDGGVTYNIVADDVPNNGNYSLTVPNTPAPACRIKIEPTDNVFFAINSQDFAIDLKVSKVCTKFASSSNLNLNITDNGDGLTESHTINIPNDVTIEDINIGVDISHSYIGDLSIAIVSPNNTEILLKTNNDCNDEQNLVGIFDDDAITYNCANADKNINQKSINDLLSIFNDENISGDWTIRLGDGQPQDTGKLNSWFIELCETTQTPIDEVNEIGTFKIFPNPSNGELNIDLTSPDTINSLIEVEVFDIRGRLIHKRSFLPKSQFNETLTLDIKSGLYILSVSNGFQKFKKKIMIK